MILTQNVTICGIKHAGKTTVSRLLAEKLDTIAMDTDEYIRFIYQNRNGGNLISVREIFRTIGEEAFRHLEADTVRAVASDEIPKVIALGGGALSNQFLTDDDRRKLGILCCLDIDDETAFRRIMRRGLPPFLQNEADPFAALCRINSERRGLFQKYTDLVIRCSDASEPADTAQKLFNAIQERCSHE